MEGLFSGGLLYTSKLNELVKLSRLLCNLEHVKSKLGSEIILGIPESNEKVTLAMTDLLKEAIVTTLDKEIVELKRKVKILVGDIS